MCTAVLIDFPLMTTPSTESQKKEKTMADLMTLKKFEALSPFEIKDELINLAKATSKTTQSAFGRRNPNWIATTPREGFFLLGQFAITESKRVMEHAAGIGGMPQAAGIAARLEDRSPKRSSGDAGLT
jgi:aspartate 4-decarboxylase